MITSITIKNNLMVFFRKRTYFILKRIPSFHSRPPAAAHSPCPDWTFPAADARGQLKGLCAAIVRVRCSASCPARVHNEPPLMMCWRPLCKLTPSCCVEETIINQRFSLDPVGVVVSKNPFDSVVVTLERATHTRRWTGR